MLTINVDITSPMRVFRIMVFLATLNDLITGADEIYSNYIIALRKKLREAIESGDFSSQVIEELTKVIKELERIEKNIEKIQDIILIKVEAPSDLSEAIKICNTIDEKLEQVLRDLEKRKFVLSDRELHSLRRIISRYKLGKLINQVYKIWQSITPSETFV